MKNWNRSEAYNFAQSPLARVGIQGGIELSPGFRRLFPEDLENEVIAEKIWNFTKAIYPDVNESNKNWSDVLKSAMYAHAIYLGFFDGDTDDTLRACCVVSHRVSSGRSIVLDINDDEYVEGLADPNKRDEVYHYMQLMHAEIDRLKHHPEIHAWSKELKTDFPRDPTLMAEVGMQQVDPHVMTIWKDSTRQRNDSPTAEGLVSKLSDRFLK